MPYTVEQYLADKKKNQPYTVDRYLAEKQDVPRETSLMDILPEPASSLAVSPGYRPPEPTKSIDELLTPTPVNPFTESMAAAYGKAGLNFLKGLGQIVKGTATGELSRDLIEQVHEDPIAAAKKLVVDPLVNLGMGAHGGITRDILGFLPEAESDKKYKERMKELFTNPLAPVLAEIGRASCRERV